MKDFITVTIDTLQRPHLCENAVLNIKYISSFHAEKEINSTIILMTQSCMYTVKEPIQEIIAKIEEAQK